MDSRAAIRGRRRGKRICPESRTVIVDVYSFMKEEYELTIRTHGDCCDLSYLRNVEQRTASATRVSVKTLQNLLKQERWERMNNLSNDAGATSERIQVQEIPKEIWQGEILEGIKIKPAVEPTRKCRIQCKIKELKLKPAVEPTKECPIQCKIKELKLKPAVETKTESTIQSKIKSAKNTSIHKTQTDNEMLRSAGNFILNDFNLTSDSD